MSLVQMDSHTRYVVLLLQVWDKAAKDDVASEYDSSKPWSDT